ncbi:MAG: hypothetical protein Athens101426_353 [Parcubacteria group bacterium Athens1014_26]|nr:MAG: hypothetical protein Athens101426_353 [Parcubacteria group bacterium Athens1014_26]
MILIYAIIFGVLLYVVDLISVKLFKQSIVEWIENVIDGIGGENVWVRLLIILGVPFGSFYLSTVLPEDSFGFWIFTILGIVSLGYAGLAWIETRDLQFPKPKAVMLLAVGIGLWILGDVTGQKLEVGSADFSSDVFVVLGWIFVIGAIIVYYRGKARK